MADFKPLNEKEIHMVKKAAEIINGNIEIPCTGCSYCTDGCPQKIAIQSIFLFIMLTNRSQRIKDGHRRVSIMTDLH